MASPFRSMIARERLQPHARRLRFPLGVRCSSRANPPSATSHCDPPACATAQRNAGAHFTVSPVPHSAREILPAMGSSRKERFGYRGNYKREPANGGLSHRERQAQVGGRDGAASSRQGTDVRHHQHVRTQVWLPRAWHRAPTDSRSRPLIRILESSLE